MEDDLFRKIIISAIPDLTCGERLLLERTAGSAEDLARLTSRDIRQAAGKHFYPRGQGSPALQACESAELAVRRRDVRCLHIWDPEYPPALRELYNPPYMVFLRGELPDQEIPSLGVWGSLIPGEQGSHEAWKFGQELYASGIPFIWDCRRGIAREVLRGVRYSALGICADRSRFFSSRLPDEGVSLLCADLSGERIPEDPVRTVIGMVRGMCFFETQLDETAGDIAEYALQEGRDVCVHASALHSNCGKRLAEEGAVVLSSIQDLLRLWE